MGVGRLGPAHLRTSLGVYALKGIEEAVWQRIDRSGKCWIWKGTRDKDGYGRLRYRGKFWRAPRLIWFLANGPIPAEKVIRHSCDNPPCVRLEHLLIGTQRDNIRDSVERGRNANLRKSRCPKGHEYTLIRNDGRRYCSPCNMAHTRTWRATRKRRVKEDAQKKRGSK